MGHRFNLVGFCLRICVGFECVCNHYNCTHSSMYLIDCVVCVWKLYLHDDIAVDEVRTNHVRAKWCAPFKTFSINVERCRD